MILYPAKFGIVSACGSAHTIYCPARNTDVGGLRRRRSLRNIIVVLIIPFGSPGTLHDRVYSEADPFILRHVGRGGSRRELEIAREESGARVPSGDLRGIRRIRKRAVEPLRADLSAEGVTNPREAAGVNDMNLLTGDRMCRDRNCSSCKRRLRTVQRDCSCSPPFQVHRY